METLTEGNGIDNGILALKIPTERTAHQRVQAVKDLPCPAEVNPTQHGRT